LLELGALKKWQVQMGRTEKDNRESSDTDSGKTFGCLSEQKNYDPGQIDKSLRENV
jgi:hypothetical protein